MDEGILSICWDTGHMDFYLDAFFPCTIPKFKQLLKIIELDWNNSKALKEVLKVYFQNQITANELGKDKTAANNLVKFNRLLQILEKNIQRGGG